MSYYGYQYQRQCYIPGGMKCSAFPQQCHNPAVVTCGSCSPCAPTGAKGCPGRKPLAIPRCAAPCRPGCVETHVVEGHHSSSSSSCSSSRCLDPCSVPFPQPLAHGRALCVPRCGQAVPTGCPQVCPGPVSQDSSCPYSYQWSKSYQYNCGQ